ncbi:hypothetical protein [Salipaludibacillus neizhouensis]|nr:hypothetical protein [Salipaludibacillus neizhouensis]
MEEAFEAVATLMGSFLQYGDAIFIELTSSIIEKDVLHIKD